MSWTWPGDLDLPPANGHALPHWSSSTEISVTERRNPRFLPQGHGKRKNVTADAELTMEAILVEIGTDRPTNVGPGALRFIVAVSSIVTVMRTPFGWDGARMEIRHCTYQNFQH
jgi:hypothetical protein